ncbi:MAG: NAD-dependent epimerase/dehydratase family protein [Methanomassiliicoccus sp.]|nr:MAG: NAD-dependent epimerase/dehydratase family protein [Methanomassiliicoccus sp.]
MILDDKKILITGGTGSLGKVLVRRILSGEFGTPKQLVILSRDEAKQHFMRLEYLNKETTTDEIIYQNFQRSLSFRIGDVRDYHTVASAVKGMDLIFNAAALKQVPTCEYFPFEAVRTNIGGPENIVRALRENDNQVETVVGISTDKACKPVNVMGMTKAIQERVFIRANLEVPDTRFVCVRYGNVLASRGSVIPLFHHQIRCGGPLTLTDERMTRFLLSLDQAVDTIFAAVKGAKPGETYIPRVPSAKMVDIADALIDGRKIKKKFTGIRPGEKIHEILISEEEGYRSADRGDYYAIAPMLPELQTKGKFTPLGKEYGSGDDLMSKDQVRDLMVRNHLMVDDAVIYEGEMLK